MTPEQREKAELEAKIAKYEAEKEQAKKSEEEKKQDEMDKRNFEMLEKQLIGAAIAHKLDQTPETMELMCDIALEAIELGYANITPAQVAQEVIRRQGEHIENRDKKILSRLDSDEKLLAYLGPDIVKRIQKASLAQVPTPAAKPRTKPVTPMRNEGGKFIRESDFDKAHKFR